MATAEMSQNGPGAEGLNDQTTQNGDYVPTVNQVFDAFEAEQELAVVISGDVRRWEEDCARAVRAAGRRGTHEGRHGSFDSTDGHERPDFVGRYPGKATVTPQLLEREYGSPDPSEVYEATA
jgi:hypothetical protein